MEPEFLPPRLARLDGSSVSGASALRPSLLPEPALPVQDEEPTLQQIGGIRDSILRREERYREALAFADVVAASVAVLAAVVMLGDGRTSAWGLLVIPAVVVLAKVVGLYDRDRDAIAKTTLDEAPTLLQVAMLYTLTLTAGASIFFGGNLRAPQVLALCGLLFVSLLVFRSAARSAVLRLSAPERCLVIADRRSSERIRNKLLEQPLRQRRGGRSRADASRSRHPQRCDRVDRRAATDRRRARCPSRDPRTISRGRRPARRDSVGGLGRSAPQPGTAPVRGGGLFGSNRRR